MDEMDASLFNIFNLYTFLFYYFYYLLYYIYASNPAKTRNLMVQNVYFYKFLMFKNSKKTLVFKNVNSCYFIKIFVIILTNIGIFNYKNSKNPNISNYKFNINIEFNKIKCCKITENR